MKLLGGRYEALMPIASGGMATVHLGRAVSVGGFERLVAIKLMHPHIANEREFVDMFLDEARLAARIRHPNVVPTLDVQHDDGLFIVMEYVDGPSLMAVRKAWQKKPLPLEIALRIAVDALAGLHAAHELRDDAGAPLKLVHRDVSPANILIGLDGVVRITDFGVARAETRLSSTRGNQVKGKLPYMPPEQLRGETVDRRCDVYAAGVVLWEQLTGLRLFKADNDAALLTQILTGPRTAPSAQNPLVPASIDAVCMRALKSSPDERFATAADFGDALEAAAADAKIALATPRILAKFVEESNAHEKLDGPRLAALKQSPESRPSPRTPTPAAPATPVGAAPLPVETPSPSAPPSASVVAPISAPPPATPHPVSAAPPPSGVTSTEATLNAEPPEPARRPYLARAIVAVVAVCGVASAVVFLHRGSERPPAPAATVTATVSATVTVTEPATAPATAPEPAPATATATATAPAPATAAATAPATARSRSGDGPAARPAPPRPPARPPQPKSTAGKAYNPDRL